MPEINSTAITPPRVPIVDLKTGLISREWYRFFLNLFTISGAGSNEVSVLDLQYAPIYNNDTMVTNLIKESELNASITLYNNLLDSLIQGLGTLPPVYSNSQELSDLRSYVDTLPLA